MKKLQKEILIKAGIPKIHFEEFPSFIEIIFNEGQQKILKEVEKIIKDMNKEAVDPHHCVPYIDGEVLIEIIKEIKCKNKL